MSDRLVNKTGYVKSRCKGGPHFRCSKCDAELTEPVRVRRPGVLDRAPRFFVKCPGCSFLSGLYSVPNARAVGLRMKRQFEGKFFISCRRLEVRGRCRKIRRR